MAIKAGRVGVAPDQVDEFGNINSEATSGYTKQEADAKFETQMHAVSTYQKKTLELPLDTLLGSKLTVEGSLEALNEIQKTRQPKTLSVPISMLQGSLLVPKTTVEDVLRTMDNAMTNEDLTEAIGSLSTASITTLHTVEKAYYTKVGNIYVFSIKLTTTSAVSAGDSLLTGLPNTNMNDVDGAPTFAISSGNNVYHGVFYSSGGVKGVKSLSEIANNTTIRFTFVMI